MWLKARKKKKKRKEKKANNVLWKGVFLNK